MKLPKTLLSALVIGLTLQATVSSCSKKDKILDKADASKEKKETKPTPFNADNCPACGLG